MCSKRNLVRPSKDVRGRKKERGLDFGLDRQALVARFIDPKKF